MGARERGADGENEEGKRGDGSRRARGRTRSRFSVRQRENFLWVWDENAHSPCVSAKIFHAVAINVDESHAIRCGIFS